MNMTPETNTVMEEAPQERAKDAIYWEANHLGNIFRNLEGDYQDLEPLLLNKRFLDMKKTRGLWVRYNDLLTEYDAMEPKVEAEKLYSKEVWGGTTKPTFYEEKAKIEERIKVLSEAIGEPAAEAEAIEIPVAEKDKKADVSPEGEASSAAEENLSKAEVPEVRPPVINPRKLAREKEAEKNERERERKREIADRLSRKLRERAVERADKVFWASTLLAEPKKRKNQENFLDDVFLHVPNDIVEITDEDPEIEKAILRGDIGSILDLDLDEKDYFPTKLPKNVLEKMLKLLHKTQSTIGGRDGLWNKIYDGLEEVKRQPAVEIDRVSTKQNYEGMSLEEKRNFLRQQIDYLTKRKIILENKKIEIDKHANKRERGSFGGGLSDREVETMEVQNEIKNVILDLNRHEAMLRDLSKEEKGAGTKEKISDT